MPLFTLYRYYFTNITVSEVCQKGVRRVSEGCQKGVRRVSEVGEIFIIQLKKKKIQMKGF